MADDPLKDAHTAIIAAIAELRAIGVPVPIALHRAAHALAYAIAQRGDCCVVRSTGSRRDDQGAASADQASCSGHHLPIRQGQD